MEPDEHPRVLFVCVENANRSQMAEAFAKLLGKGRVRAESAGSKPSGRINPRAIEAMREVGYDLRAHHSKGLDTLQGEVFDVVVTMGCGDRCAGVRGARVEDWAIPDPRDLPEKAFRQVRDSIERRVSALIADLQAKHAMPRA